MGAAEVRQIEAAESRVMPTMVPVPIAETAQMRRLIEFASDVTQLADERIDGDLRELIDGLHADLLNLKGEEPMTDPDADRLKLLDRLAARMPELDLEQHLIEWRTLPDNGAEGLLVDGGGIDGGNGFTFANHGEDVHAVGPTSPIIPGCVGCVVIRPDGSRYLARAVPDPLA
jgi:hypothetical protein